MGREREKREALQRLHDEYRKRVKEEAMRDRTFADTFFEDEIKHIHTNHDEGC
jgi:hypothetical protein